MMALGNEYKRRYGRTHMSIDKCGHLHEAPADIPHEPFEQPPQAMPDEYKSSCAIDAYRKYYCEDKREFCTWTNRDIPNWWPYAEVVELVDTTDLKSVGL